MKNEKKLKLLNQIAVAITVVILFLVGLTSKVRLDLGVDFTFMPAVNSLLNTGVTICLLMALVFIKRGDVQKHRYAIYTAFVLSIVFILCYTTYRFTTEETAFCKQGAIRSIYFFILISHIVLAGFSLPFILFAFNKAFCGFYEEHKRMVKWVYPLWLYVAITGPVVYLMLRPCYGL